MMVKLAYHDLNQIQDPLKIACWQHKYQQTAINDRFAYNALEVVAFCKLRLGTTKSKLSHYD